MWHQLNQYSSARDLIDSIVRFGQDETNPVLTILENKPPHEKHHYPPDGISFGNKLWRAFYHSHDTPLKDPAEHGHFHFFARFEKHSSDWTHVAALSVDQYGQPIEWFAANKWVVNDVWHSAAYLKKHLPSPKSHSDCTPVCKWMGAMLGTYRDEIDNMLLERDLFVARLAQKPDQCDVLEDRSFWRLSRYKIDLQSKLKSVLDTECVGTSAAMVGEIN